MEKKKIKKISKLYRITPETEKTVIALAEDYTAGNQSEMVERLIRKGVEWYEKEREGMTTTKDLLIL